MSKKERIHQLVDRLPESELAALERVLADAMLRALLSVPDGEDPLTLDEISGILEAKRDTKAGRTRRFSNVEELISELNADQQG